MRQGDTRARQGRQGDTGTKGDTRETGNRMDTANRRDRGDKGGHKETQVDTGGARETGTVIKTVECLCNFE